MKFTIFNKIGKRTVIVIFVIALIILFLLFSNYGIIKRFNLIKKKHDLIEKINREKSAEDSLKKQIYLLEHDKTEIERIAREKYGMIKPGEKVYIIHKKEEKK